MSGMKGESEGSKASRLLRYVAGQLLHCMVETLKRVGFLAAGLLMAAFIAGCIREGLDYVTELHWLLGLILSVVIVVLLILLIRWLSQQPLTHKAFGYYPLQGFKTYLGVTL